MPKKKKEKECEKIEFPDRYTVIGADLSLTRPGFALLVVDGHEIIRVILASVDNKGKKKKIHGQILDEIVNVFEKDIVAKVPAFGQVYMVREKEIMHMKVPSERSVTKTVGIMDWILYRYCEENKNLNNLFLNKEWYEMYPVTVKKLITGSGKAEKEEVAAALERYIGKQEYKCDDESDAAAVAVAWLIQQGQIKSEGDSL